MTAMLKKANTMMTAEDLVVVMATMILTTAMTTKTMIEGMIDGENNLESPAEVVGMVMVETMMMMMGGVGLLLGLPGHSVIVEGDIIIITLTRILEPVVDGVEGLETQNCTFERTSWTID